MGKYMKKSKITGEVAVMEVSQSSLGVRTRAKTLALQRLQKITTASTATTMTNSGSCYLQLRNRRLEKPPLLVATINESNKQHQSSLKESCKQNPNPSSRLAVNSENSGSIESVSISMACSKNIVRFSSKKATTMVNNDENRENNNDLEIEASFDENILEIEGRERTTRETTPCSLIRDSETIATPGSTTKPTTNRRIRNMLRRDIPTAHEMDVFFDGEAKQQQRFFTEKYNFDPVNELPLPGRFEWVRVDP